MINPENVRATILPVQTDVLDFPIGPHNIVVGVLVELGIVGLILLFGVARSLFRGRARSEAAVLARAVMIGFAVQSLFLGIANLKQVWLFAAITLGLAAAERLSQRRRPDAVGASRHRRRARLDRWGGGAAPAPALAAAAAAAGAATDEAIPLGPPAAKPHAKATKAKAGTSRRHRRRRPLRRLAQGSKTWLAPGRRARSDARA